LFWFGQKNAGEIGAQAIRDTQGSSYGFLQNDHSVSRKFF